MSKLKGIAFWRSWKWPLLFLPARQNASFFECSSICIYKVCISYPAMDVVLSFFFSLAIAVLVGMSLTVPKSRGTRNPKVLLSFRDDLLLLSTCVPLIRILFGVAWVSFTVSSQVGHAEMKQNWYSNTTLEIQKSVVAPLFNNKAFQSLWNVSSVLWVWLWRGFSESVLEVIISHWLWQVFTSYVKVLMD